MKPGDIEKLHSVSAPSIAPDSSRVVVSVSHPDLSADAVVGQIWTVPLDGSNPHRITRGRSDSSPQFSPDGSVIAFLRGGAGSPPQLAIMAADGGEPTVITDAKLGVRQFAWSPDSRQIAYLATVPQQGRYGTVDGISSAAEPARHITDLKYKYNALGYTGDQRSQVFLVEVPDVDGEPVYVPAPLPDGTTPDHALVPVSRQLTDGPFDTSAPRFIGSRVGFVSARHDSRDRDLVNQLWSVSPGGEPEPLIAVGTLSIESFDEVDGTVYFIAPDLGSSRNDFVGTNSALYRLDGGEAHRLTDPEVTDLTGATLVGGGGAVLVPYRERGRVHLLEVRGGAVSTLTSGDIEVGGVAASGDLAIVTYATPASFGDVALLRGGAITPLTDFSATLREMGVTEPAERTITARDGYPVHGWVARPAGEGPHPTLLMIHGGPYADYGIHVFDETQVYVEAGYAVVYCNPRGSAGYGQAHGRAITQAMGTVDMTDVLDFLEAALDSDPQLDRDRLGILGGSYGGYLTAWIIAHDHRFGAAIVERGYLDPTAFIGSSDIGMFFPQQYNGSDRELMRSQSPQEFAHQVTTPTFVIHSENDLRCPIAQAETYFATLKLQGVDAEMLIFPGENHELSRAGRPRHRVQRFEAILDWFERKL